MRIEEDVKLDYADVLLKPKRSRLLSRSEVNLVRNFSFPHSTRGWRGVPIVAANMDTVGTFEVAEVLATHQMLTCIHKHYRTREWREASSDWLYTIPSMGIGSRDVVSMAWLNMELIPRGEQTWLCMDVANGYSQAFVESVARTRDAYPDVILIAGNVATPEMTEELILHGADVVKVGIGPGSVCTTRKVTGVGYPQLSAVMECSDAAHGLDGHIMADGGCSTPGDIAKAFCGGADFVMLGGMLAGHDETGTGFYGMSSDTAMDKYSGGVAAYRASEGKTVSVPSRGPLDNTIQQILGGVRSCCTYIGADCLKNAPKCATFVRVNHQYNTVFGG